MAFKKVADLDCTSTTALGGKDKKTGKANPKSIEGYFIGSKQVDSAKSKNGLAYLHVFQTQDGNVGVWGKTNLDSQMRRVRPGTMTRVTFTGMVETKNNPMYKYEVEIDSENTIDVESVASYGQEPESDDVEAEHAAFEEHMDSLEEQQVDEVRPARATRPAVVAQAPSAERQAAVRAMLSNRNRS